MLNYPHRSLFVHLLILHRGEKRNRHYQIKICLSTDFYKNILVQKEFLLEIKRQHIIDGLLLRFQANWHENGENVLNIYVS
jgi:hypothetical protein